MSLGSKVYKNLKFYIIRRFGFQFLKLSYAHYPIIIEFGIGLICASNSLHCKKSFNLGSRI